MGLGNVELTGDYTTFPRVRFPAWLTDRVFQEVARLGPDFNVAFFGRQALRFALQNAKSLPAVPPPFDGKTVYFMGPADLLRRVKAIARVKRPGHDTGYAAFVRSAFLHLLSESESWPTRAREPMRPVCRLRVPDHVARAIFAHLKRVGEPNQAYFLRESLWYAVEHSGDLPELPAEPARRLLTTLRVPISLQEKVFRIADDPAQFALRAVMLRLQVVGAQY